MIDSIVKLLIGDLEEKKAYKKFKKRVDVLPKDYKFAFNKIQHYMYSVGPINGDVKMFNDFNIFISIVDLFEESAAQGKKVLDVIGNDISKFADDLMQAYANDKETYKEKINKEIMEEFNKEEK